MTTKTVTIETAKKTILKNYCMTTCDILARTLRAFPSARKITISGREYIVMGCCCTFIGRV